MARQTSGAIAISHATFKWIFKVVLTLTVMSLVISLVLSLFANPSSLQTSLFETCTTTWKMGFGAIVGLIGAKAIDLSG